MDNSRLSFSKNAYGKPYLVGFPNFHYNISYTKCTIVIGFSDKPIGVDVENIRAIDIKIAKRFFSKNELDYVLSNDESSQKLFCEIWAKKEAYVKWNGKGLSMAFSSFDVTDNRIGEILSLFKVDDYIISICSEKNFGCKEIVELNEHQASQISAEFIDFLVRNNYRSFSWILQWLWESSLVVKAKIE